MACSPSSTCTVSLASASVTVSAKIGIAGSRRIVHPKDPTLIICIGPNDFYLLDWNLSLLRALKIERSLDHNKLSPSQGQEKVVEILPTANKTYVLLQTERMKERTFLILEAPSNPAAVGENETADVGDISTKIFPHEFQSSFSSGIILILDLLPPDCLIFLSKDFSICSAQLSVQHDMLPLPLLLAAPMESIPDSRRAYTNTHKPSGSSSLKTSTSDGSKTLFWLPRDWISRDCLALSKIWRKERSLLCPRNGEIAVVRCAAIG